jgi:hypothetical protein
MQQCAPPPPYNNPQSQYNQGPQYNTLRGDNQGNRGGYRGGGHGGRGYRGGQGPVVCNNCQKPRYYARYCPLPPATYMYYHAAYNDTKDCLTLLVKMQEKRNQNNRNVQWIPVKNRKEDGKKINIVTICGAKTRDYETKNNQDIHQWVRKNVEPEQKFDAFKEDTFKEARHDILKENILSTSGNNPIDVVPLYDMPQLFDQTNKDQPAEKVSNLRKFWVSSVKLLNDKSSLPVLQNLLEKCNVGEEGVKTVNQVHKKRITSR